MRWGLVRVSFNRQVKLSDVPLVSFPRKALQPITLMDGTYIPKGAYVSSNFSIHLDDDIYPDAHKFDGYRFLPETTPGGKSNNSSGFVRTNSHYLIFGHGKHPW